MVTVPTITRNVAGRSLSAPDIPAVASGGPKVAAVEAATMPRGSIQPTKARSRTDKWLRNVAAAATRGRTRSTSPAIRTSVGPRTDRTELTVTVAEIEMNRSP